MGCDHPIRMNNLCGVCGEEQLDGRGDCALLGNEDIYLNEKESKKIKQEHARRLKKDKKLILIMDLDQTLVDTGTHGIYGVDVLREDKKEQDNIFSTSPLDNTTSIENVNTDYSFQFTINNYNFYVKVRPHLKSFLDSLLPFYQFYIYSMGTKEYVTKVLEVIDKNKKYFGDRILTRDDNHGLLIKNIRRILCGTKRNVLILDDREDVWIEDKNIILIRPYRYFYNKYKILKEYADSAMGDLAEEDGRVRLLSMDNELLKLKYKFLKIHRKYFNSKDRNVYKIYRRMRRNIFRGLLFRNNSDYMKRIIERYGGKIDNENYDYYVGTKKVEGHAVIKEEWVLECVYQFKIVDFEEYIL